jgi:hypothetical protein
MRIARSRLRTVNTEPLAEEREQRGRKAEEIVLGHRLPDPSTKGVRRIALTPNPGYASLYHRYPCPGLG